jgi:hypothetical protein
MSPENINTWLLEGDPAIRYQVKRDLLSVVGDELHALRNRIQTEGWGAKLLSLQDPDGKWAGAIYSPKWTSTTYTLLLLKRFGLNPDNEQAKTGAKILLEAGYYGDGGINYFGTLKNSEMCVTAMIATLLFYFKVEDDRKYDLIEFLLDHRMPDGAWNCHYFRKATHSSFHTTISVLECFRELEQHTNKFDEAIKTAGDEARELLLRHRIYKSDKTGEIVDQKWTRFSFPPRWRYDAMRCLDYLQSIDFPYDARMRDALDLLMKKRNKNGTWNVQQKHAGRTFFDMEQTGKPSRWNTLRALRILKKYPEAGQDRV